MHATPRPELRLLAVALLLPSCALFESDDAAARLVAEDVVYATPDGATCRGYLAYDESLEGPRPGVLVVHEWWGHNDYVRRRADMLARMGYTAFALDMYGEGKHTGHPKEAQQFMQAALDQREVSRERFRAARRILQDHPTTDSTRTAAIGYCFGGGVVLDMARTGSDLDGVASFHGSLGTDAPTTPAEVRTQVLVCTGDADVMVQDGQLEGLREEFGSALELVVYPGAKHGFTNPAADQKAAEFDIPLGYDAAADAGSWRALEVFLARVFE